MSGPAAQISLTDFTSSLLAPWFADSEAGQAGDVVSSPRDAAAMGAFAAAVTFGGKRGVVLVTAPDASSARSCFEYARAYFSDQEQLSRLVKAIASDMIELRSGVKIVITADTTRRPRNLLATIALKPEAAAPVWNGSDFDFARLCHHVLLELDRGAAADPQAKEMLHLLAPEGADPEQWLAGMFARRDVPFRQKAKPLAPSGSTLTRGDDGTYRPAAPGPIGADGYYSAEFTAQDAARRERAAMHGGLQHRAIMGARR